jgi:hypothetical protein
MKLGTETGSLVNHLSCNKSVHDIVLGETGATLYSWSDRNAATVVDTFTKGKYDYYVVQRDNAKRVDNNGESESQDYVYTRNLEAGKSTFRVGKNGFEAVMFNPDTGRYSAICGGLSIGNRVTYRDPSF